MKSTISSVLTLCFALAMPGLGAEKKPKKPAGKPSTVPAKSSMIVVPPPAEPAIRSGEPAKLISSEMSGKDLQFFTNAVNAGRLQAYLVELLRTKADSEQIKALGAALFDMQEDENKQIARVAASKGWTVSTAPTAAQKAIGAELEKQTASHFDKAVMDKLIAASRESVSAYEAAAQSTDPDVKLLAEKMLPMAQEKLRLAEKMTGAGKAAGQLFRTGAPPKPAPVAAPPADAVPKSTPAPKKPRKSAPEATPEPKSTPEAKPSAA